MQAQVPPQRLGLVFFSCAVTFLAVALGSGQYAFLGVGFAFLTLGIVFLAKGRRLP